MGESGGRESIPVSLAEDSELEWDGGVPPFLQHHTVASKFLQMLFGDTEGPVPLLPWHRVP